MFLGYQMSFVNNANSVIEENASKDKNDLKDIRTKHYFLYSQNSKINTNMVIKNIKSFFPGCIMRKKLY